MSKSDLTHDNVTQILRLVDLLPDGEVRIEVGDLKLHVRKGDVDARPLQTDPQPLQAAAPTGLSAEMPSGPVAVRADQRARDSTRSAEAQPATPKLEAGLITIAAPMLGRFYRASSPGEAPFVEVGSRVAPGNPVCLIEVMKLFNTVSAGVAGVIVEILPLNNAMVEFNQPLFTVQPD